MSHLEFILKELFSFFTKNNLYVFDTMLNDIVIIDFILLLMTLFSNKFKLTGY